jgi:hypothetical protein
VSENVGNFRPPPVAVGGRPVPAPRHRDAIYQTQTPAAPGAAATVTAEAPADPGGYVLRITRVQENVAWFDNRGMKPLDLPISIA